MHIKTAKYAVKIYTKSLRNNTVDNTIIVLCFNQLLIEA